jgi:membrane protease subunit HflK
VAEGSDTPQRIRRGAARAVTNGLLVLTTLGLIGGWGATGFYRLELGEAAVIMYLGSFDRIERREGLSWHLPPPIEFAVPVNVVEIRSISFGMEEGNRPAMSDDGAREVRGEETGTFSRFVQTADNNIVSVSYELQYAVNNPYSFAFGMVEPDRILHDATQASLRQVIGGKSIDDVLIFQKQKIEREARSILQTILSEYSELIIRDPEGARATVSAEVDAAFDPRSPFSIDKVSLQTVHPPAQVRGAFEDVKAAQQDEDRAVSRARGDAREIIERARAEASELEEGSQAYKQARILESRGEAQRFSALLTEYRRAPEVTRRRLHLEVLEDVLARADKMVVDPDASSVIPIFSERSRAALPAVASPPPPPSAPASSGVGGAKE